MFAPPASSTGAGDTVLGEFVGAYTTTRLILGSLHGTCFQSMYTPLQTFCLLGCGEILYTHFGR